MKGVGSAVPVTAVSGEMSQDVHQRIGALTRQLHDSLRGLGLTEKVKSWAGEIPDARSRLS